MPCYIYEGPDGERKEVYQGMNDVHVYAENGVEWRRVFTVPQAAIDSIVKDPYSSKEFIQKTSRPGTYGDLIDRSNELSAMRADKDGIDFIRQKEDEKWSKQRGGKKLPKKFKDVVVDVKIK